LALWLALAGCATGGKQPLADWHARVVPDTIDVRVRSWRPAFDLPGSDPEHTQQAADAEGACLREVSLHHRFASAGETVDLVVGCMAAKGWKVEETTVSVTD
jgi:hypothetical protein